MMTKMINDYDDNDDDKDNHYRDHNIGNQGYEHWQLPREEQMREGNEEVCNPLYTVWLW